jgi:hypothetical protein
MMRGRRIIQEPWYWPTIKKIGEQNFRKKEARVDLLLDLAVKGRSCCQKFGFDIHVCHECYWWIFNI